MKKTVFNDSRVSNGEKIFACINYAFLTLLVIITLFPLLNVIALSFSGNNAILSGKVNLIPVDFNLGAYQNIISDGNVFRALGNTVFVTVAGTALSMFFTIMCAYPLSKKRLKGRKFFNWIILFTMLFHGGMIPTFILVKNLGIMDTYWALWFPPMVSVYNMIILRTSFEGIPDSLEEAASIDGANTPYILFRIVLPISLPILATLTLFYAVGLWNSYMHPLLYITSADKQVLMVKLMQTLSNVTDAILESEGVRDDNLTPEAIKSATIVVATVPIMCVYPFLQKYFVKGVMVGAIKG